MLGPQWPPYALVPKAFTTAAADELADFARVIGQPNDEWQHNTLRIGCGEKLDGTWAAPEMAVFTQRQNGKGGVFEIRGLGGLFVLGERHLIYTAHNIDTAKMTFDRCVLLVDGCDDLRRRVKRINQTNSEEAIELIGGAELQFRTRGQGRGKGRGFSCDCLFLDEALYLRQDTVDALLPTMLARPNPQIWYLSTPPEDPQAAIVRIREDGLAGVAGMAMAGWWNERGADLSDEAVLAHANPAWGIRLNREVMVLLRRRLGEEGYARECGGIWPATAAEQWLVISEADWSDAYDRYSTIAGRVVLAVATQRPDRSWVAIGVAGRRADGRRHVEVVEYAPGTRWVVPRLVELDAAHKPLVLVIDDQQLADEAEQAGLIVYRPTAGDMVSACGGLYAAVADPDPDRRDLVHIGQPELTAAVAGAVKRDVGGLWAWERRSVEVDVCPLVADSLALWALDNTRIHRRAAVPMAAYA